jgi:hypothetical protein
VILFRIAMIYMILLVTGKEQILWYFVKIQIAQQSYPKHQIYLNDDIFMLHRTTT